MAHPARISRLRARLQRFARQEDGAIVWLTLILLIPMILVGGFAVDLMRYESRRAALQGITDQAVLAAASLNQTLTPLAVIEDYFTKAGDLGRLDGTPEIKINGANRLISANGEVDVPTFFLGHDFGLFGLTGPKLLSAGSASTAVEGVGATEVSLVLDISGSMHEYVSGTGKRRMELLQEAAVDFVDDLLDPEIPGRVSISLVPYSSQVNAGPDLFGVFTTSKRHDFSYCIEFDEAEFSTTVIDFTKTYDQTLPFQFNTFGKLGARDTNNPDPDQPVCPNSYQDRGVAPEDNTFPDPERITVFSQNETDLTNQINRLEPRGGTATHLGLKWGVTLLDPSIQPKIETLPDTVRDPDFSNRPRAHIAAAQSGQSVTLKYVILVTDGETSSRSRLRPEYTDTPSELDYFGRHNLPYAVKHLLNGSRSDYIEEIYTADKAVGWMRSMCTAAKDQGILIYTISVTGEDTTQEAEDGRTEMRNCATDPSFFFKSTGANLDSIFEQIAKQVTDLRLTL